MHWLSRVVPVRPPASENEASPQKPSPAKQPSRRNVAFVHGEVDDVSAFPAPDAPFLDPDSWDGDVGRSSAGHADSPLTAREPSRAARYPSAQAHELAPKVHAAVKQGDVTELAALIERGADVTLPDLTPSAMRCTPLHYAVLCGRTRLCDPPAFGEATALAMVEMILDSDAVVNAVDEMGCTALHCAAALGLESVVAELLSRGAFMDIQDYQIKYTPLHAAASAGQVGCILLMIEAGAFVDEEVARAINATLADGSIEAQAWPGLCAARDICSGLLRRSGVLSGKNRRPTRNNAEARDGGEEFEEETELSLLQRGRNGNVLPNGGGRLWAMKDVTGSGIWDVLDSPATACAVLDVLLQDVAHMDLMGPRSLVQLVEQTQSLRHVIGVAQRTVAQEAARTGMPPGEVASQLDAVKTYLTRVQTALQQHAMRHPQRGRMPLPMLRPTGTGTSRGSRPGSGAKHQLQSELTAHSMVNMRRPGKPRGVRLTAAGLQKDDGSTDASPRSPASVLVPAGPIDPALRRTRASSPASPQARSKSAIAPQPRLTARALMFGDAEEEHAQKQQDEQQHEPPPLLQMPELKGRKSLPSLPAPPPPHGVERKSPGLGELRNSLPSLPGPEGGLSNYSPGMLAKEAVESVDSQRTRTSLHQPGSLAGHLRAEPAPSFILSAAGLELAHAPREGSVHLPALAHHPHKSHAPEEASFHLPPLPSHKSHAGPPLPPALYPAPVAEGVEPTDSDECSSTSNEAPDAEEAWGCPPEGDGVEVLSVWLHQPWRCLPSDDGPTLRGPGPVAEATGDDALVDGTSLRQGAIARAWQTAKTSTTVAGAAAQSGAGGAAPSEPIRTSANRLAPGELRTSANRGVQGDRLSGGRARSSARRAESGALVWRRRPTLGRPAVQEESPPTKPAPPGFKVWTLTVETKMYECIGCIQWQTLKLEQYVEAMLTLARDSRSTPEDDEAPRARRRNAHLIISGNVMAAAGGDPEGEDLAGVEMVWEMVRQAIMCGNRVLSHLMVDRLVCMFPRALLRCPWSSVMVDMCQVFPEVFHHLLVCLKEVSDEVRTAFVTSFNLSDVEAKLRGDKLQAGPHTSASVNPSFKIAGTSRERRDSRASTGSQGGMEMRVRRMSSNVQLDRRRQSMPLTRMTSAYLGHAPDLGLLAHENAASYKYTLYRNLVAGLTGVDYTLMKCFVEKLDRTVLKEMAQMSVYKDFVSLLPTKLIKRPGGAPDVINEEMGDVDKAAAATPLGVSFTSRRAASAGGASAATDHSRNSIGGLTLLAGRSFGNADTMLGTGGAGPATMRGIVRRQQRGGLESGAMGEGGDAVNETRAEVLNVESLLKAALLARSAESVQAAVDSLVSWVEINARNKRLCFIDGLSTRLVSEMATHFPSAAGALFHISPQASRDIKVSSWLLGKSPTSYACSATRYSFMWRSPELDELRSRGYDLAAVEQLADHNMRFMYICRAAQQGCSVDDILELMQLGLMGHHIADLVSSGARLESVRDALEGGLPPELIASMLSQKLSWQLVEVLLNHRVTRTTVEDRTLRLELLQFDNSGGKMKTFSHAFVARFLERWSEANWEKAFIDKVFHAGDTLCTKLKTAYDYKLSMRTNYMAPHSAQVLERSVFDWRRLLVIMSAFLQPRWALSRWMTVGVFGAVLAAGELAGVGRRMLPLTTTQEHTVDATAKVLPIINAAMLGPKSLLAGLMYADVPSAWYGTPVARAVIAVQWKGFAQVLMAMYLLEHLLMITLYGAFLYTMQRSLMRRQRALDAFGTPLSPLQREAAEQGLLETYQGGDLSVTLDDVAGSSERGLILALLVTFALSNIITRTLQLRRAGFALWASNLGNHIDVLCSTLCLITIAVALVGTTFTVVMSVGSAAVLVLFVRLVLFASLVERMGSLVRVVTEIVKDLRYFFILLAVIFGGFAFAFFVQLGANNSLPLVAVQLFTTMTGDFQASMLEDVLSVDGDWLSPRLALALWLIYGFLVGIVLVSLLISIMNDTFDRIKDAEEVEVLRNKARIIVDLQTLLPPGAMRKLQAASLGPFLHTLSATVVDTSTRPTLTKLDEWQGRMQQIRNAVRLELTNHMSSGAGAGGKKKDGGDDKEGSSALHRELAELQAVLRAVRTDVGQLARSVSDLQVAGAAVARVASPAPGVAGPSGLGLVPGQGTAATTPTAGAAASAGADAAVATPAVSPGRPSIAELVRNAASVLGPGMNPLGAAPVTGGVKHVRLSTHSTAGAKAEEAAKPMSPAVIAALEGRTMLRMSSLPGRFFSRQIPSSRAGVAQPVIWKLAARVATAGEGLSGLRIPPSPSPASRRLALQATRSEPGASGSGGPASPAGTPTPPSGRPSGGAGLLTRFAIHTLTSLTRSSPAAAAAAGPGENTPKAGSSGGSLWPEGPKGPTGK